MSTLVADGLAIARGGRVILRDLHFSLNSGQGLHVCGPNGSGKTSLLEVLAGLRDPDEGGISGAPEAADLHYVGVRNALSPALSPQQNLEFWCGLNDVAHDGIPGALERFGVARIQHRASRTLSNGQRRRVALARLWLAPRKWWFLDEPLNALDHDGVEIFVALLSAHLHGGGCAIIASHQMLPAHIDSMQRLDLA